MRRLTIGYVLVCATALVWIAATILDRTHMLSAASPYRDTVLAQGLGYTTLGLGILVVIMSIVTPVTVRFGNQQRHHR